VNDAGLPFDQETNLNLRPFESVWVAGAAMVWAEPGVQAKS